MSEDLVNATNAQPAEADLGARAENLRKATSNASSRLLQELSSGSRDCFRQIVECSHDAVIILDSCGEIHFWNAAAERLFGFPASEALERDFFETVTPVRYRVRERKLIHDFQQEGNFGVLGENCEIERLRCDGSEIWTEQSFSPLQVGTEHWACVTLRDADARKRRELELTRQATSDSLTGLANRREFQRQLEQHLGQPLCLAILDIDRFKGLNDAYGHPVGDDAIKKVAIAMLHHFGDAVCIGRLGGDEFGILLTTAEQEAKVAEEELQRRFEQLRIAMSLPHEPQKDLTISIGVALAQHNATARELLTCADRQLYQSKAAGRNKVSVTILPAA